jgi:raffinose/stachyose/melibiose transport system substrate-binding protein
MQPRRRLARAASSRGRGVKLALSMTCTLLIAACSTGVASQAPTASSAPSASSAASAPASASGSDAASADACAGVSDKVTLRIASVYAGSEPSAVAWDKAMKQWAADHAACVDLVREEVAGDDYRTKLTVDLAANNSADIMSNWAGAQTRTFVDAGVLLPVEEYFNKSTSVSADLWDEAAMSPINGANYNLNLEGFKCFMLYNTELFDKYGVKPPTTQQELYDVSKTFNSNDIVPIDTGSKGGNPGHLFYNQILDQLPGGEETRSPITDEYDLSAPVFTDAAKVVNDWKANGVFPKDTVANGDWGPSIQLYNQGKAAMLYTCPWETSSIEPTIAGVSELMTFPTVPNAARQGSDFSIGEPNHGLTINKASFDDPAKQAMMVSLLDYIFSDNGVKNSFVEAGVWPAYKVDTSKLDLPELTKKTIAFTDNIPETFPTWLGAFPNTAALNAGLEAMDKLFSGDDPAAVMKQLATDVAAQKP